MSVRKKEELLSSINAIIGENPTDEALALLDDVSDTIDEYETNQRSVEDVDKQWREKYRQRFFSTDENIDDEKTMGIDKPTPKTFEDLFKEE